MQVVANHLVLESKKRYKTADADMFARAAFNRYYYATFLRVREELVELGQWKPDLAHKAVPDFLKGRVIKYLRAGLIRSQNGCTQLKPHNQRTYSHAKTAAAELATLLERAYAIRRAADYDPDESVLVDRDSVRMLGATAASAQRWALRANTSLGAIRRAYRAAGLV